MNTQPETVCEARAEHHVNLSNAIHQLNEARTHLADLLTKIQGNRNPVDPATKEQDRVTPSLTEVLCGGPVMIRDQIDAMHNLINEIDNHLF